MRDGCLDVEPVYLSVRPYGFRDRGADGIRPERSRPGILRRDPDGKNAEKGYREYMYPACCGKYGG